MRKLLLVPTVTAVLAAAASCAPEPVEEASPIRIVASDLELMMGIIVPNAAVVWDSVGTIVDETGQNDFQPETDEEWEEVADRALGLAESANLLLIPERSQGRQVGIATAVMMRDRAIRASETALLRDAAAFLDSVGLLYESCVACHEEDLVEGTGF